MGRQSSHVIDFSEGDLRIPQPLGQRGAFDTGKDADNDFIQRRAIGAARFVATELFIP